MANDVAIIKCNTVGDLLDELAEIAKDPDRSDLLDATIDGPGGETFTGFKIVRRKLSDKSHVLDFELLRQKIEALLPVAAHRPAKEFKGPLYTSTFPEINLNGRRYRAVDCGAYSDFFRKTCDKPAGHDGSHLSKSGNVTHEWL